MGQIEIEDHLLPEGASWLATRLRDFWRARGFLIETQVVQVAQRRMPVFCVRSNLHCGLPQECRDDSDLRRKAVEQTCKDVAARYGGALKQKKRTA